MGFWSNLLGIPNHEDVIPNSNGIDYNPGDPDGFEVAEGDGAFSRSLPIPMTSPWSGWPADWSTPHWDSGVQKLVDTAWACLDLNASILSTMPVYRMQSGRIAEPMTWMANPDPDIYTSWHEFAKQLFWDYQMGETFVLPTDWSISTGRPLRFRVVPPHMVKVEMNGSRRSYKIGQTDVSDDILHVRYKSTTQSPRGVGPLESSNARMVTAGVLTRYVSEMAETGGQTHEWLVVEKLLTKGQADDLLEQWVDSRKRNLGLPAVLSGGADLKQAKAMSAKDMALLELAQFTESRIAIMLGVPPFLVGLPSGGDSMTYSNVSSLFDFHHRASLGPKATPVMAALSGWALPRGQRAELNRDEYTRPALLERAQAYEKLHATDAITPEEIRTMERLHGAISAEALTGGDDL